MTRARKLPGVIHLKPFTRALGVPQYRSAIMMVTRTTRTGHLTIDHTVRAVSPIPSAEPALWARVPVKTTIRALTTASTIRTTVRPTRTGRIFQIGRPSGMS